MIAKFLILVLAVSCQVVIFANDKNSTVKEKTALQFKGFEKEFEEFLKPKEYATEEQYSNVLASRKKEYDLTKPAFLNHGPPLKKFEKIATQYDKEKYDFLISAINGWYDVLQGGYTWLKIRDAIWEGYNYGAIEALKFLDKKSGLNSPWTKISTLELLKKRLELSRNLTESKAEQK